MLTKMKTQAWKKYTRTAIIIAMIVAINSCKVTLPYSQPSDANNNKLYRDVSNADTSNIATISWKQMFTDTLLQLLVQEGINNNLDLKIAIARIKTAAANAKQSKLALLPGFDANGTATFEKVPSTQFGFPQAIPLAGNNQLGGGCMGKTNQRKKSRACIITAKRSI